MGVTNMRGSAASERIRQAAIASFAELGFAGTSTREIAKRLGMSPAAMYPHFSSKEELLYAISLEGHRALLTALRAADVPELSDGDRLRVVVGEFARWQAEHHELAKVVQYELHELTREHYRTITAIRRDTTAVLQVIVQRGIDSGEFTVAATGDAVLALSSLCVDVCRWFPSRTHQDAVALGEAYGHLAVRMVR